MFPQRKLSTDNSQLSLSRQKPSSTPTTVTRSSTTKPASLLLLAAPAPKKLSAAAAADSEGALQLSHPQSSDQTMASAPGLRQQASHAGSESAAGEDPRGEEGEEEERLEEEEEDETELSPQSMAGAAATSLQLEAAMPLTRSRARRCAASARV